MFYEILAFLLGLLLGKYINLLDILRNLRKDLGGKQ